MSELWTGDFGTEYTRRNIKFGSTVDARRRVFEQILPKDCRSVLEVGANCGDNLAAISQISPCQLFAVEPNEEAREQLYHRLKLPIEHVRSDLAAKLSFTDAAADLAFTCGVLIHIPTDDLLASMRQIHRCAGRYIICGEYFAPSEEMIPYRGHDNALWRRDYGSLWLDNFPDLRCTQQFFAWKRTTGLDNITFWVFEKTGLH